MAQDLKPDTWLPDWTEDATNITVPLASIPEVTAAEADGATGDIRKVAFGLAEALYDHFNGLPLADRPTNMVITRGSSVNDQTNEMTRTYGFTFKLAPATGALEVVDEPS
jgi:hypothetical protein